MPPSRESRLQDLDAALLVLRRLWQRPEVQSFLATRLDPTIKLEHYRTLRAIERSPAPLSVGELADRLRINASTGSRIVDRLVSLGLVERRADDDRRRSTVGLTELGRSSLITLQSSRVACLNQMTRTWRASEIGDLARLLRRLDESCQELVPVAQVPRRPPTHYDSTGRPGVRGGHRGASARRFP
jgi:DNA-binding MarR family transcriptional regulator